MSTKWSQLLLTIIGLAYIANGFVMWFFPLWWYETVPGIKDMGMFHMHFVRDIGLIYGVTALGLFWSISEPKVGLFACLWPSLHAIYHLAIFFDRGMLLDATSATNLFLIQIPAWLSLYIIIQLFKMNHKAL